MEELEILLDPEGVHNVKSKALSVFAFGAFTATGKLQVQCVESGVKSVLREDEAQSICHLVFGLTASSVLSLFLIPSLYLVMGDIKRLMMRRRMSDEAGNQARWKARVARRRELAEVDHS